MRVEDIRLHHNPNNTSQSPIVVDIYDMFLQEIDILFGTDHNEVLNSGGESDWANLKKLIFETGITEITLKNELINLIRNECPSSETVKFNLDIKFVRGTESDIGLIDVFIYDDRNMLVRDKNYFIG